MLIRSRLVSTRLRTIDRVAVVRNCESIENQLLSETGIDGFIFLPYVILIGMESETLVEIPTAALEKLLRGERDTVRASVTPNAPQSTPIGETQLNEEHTIVGVVRSISDINTFQRNDGTDGQVRNVRIQDRTGDIRVALWGDKAEIQMEVGDYLHLFDAEVDTGYEDAKEASVGYDSTLQVLPQSEVDTDQHVTITKASNQ